MSSHTLSPRFIRPKLSASTILAAALLFMLALAPLSLILVGAQPVSANPLLVNASIVSRPSGQIAIHGEGFSPGGIVYIAVFDRSGQDVQYNAWAVATEAVYGPNGSSDPAQGYVAAGTINEVISLDSSPVYGPHGSQDPAWGFNGVIPLVPTATYGPHGSQDPAQGYDDGTRPPLALDIGCVQHLSVQAFDARALSWSNRLEVVAGC